MLLKNSTGEWVELRSSLNRENILLDGLCGVVVKTPASYTENPEFESCLTVESGRRLLNAFVIECD